MLLKGERLHAQIVHIAQVAMLAVATLSPLLLSAAPVVAADPMVNVGPDLALESASADARHALRWVMDTWDNQGLPFVIVDKKSARIFVFEATGQLRGASPALLGLTPGDHSVPDMEQRQVASLRADERTTPAGRFVSEPGHNLRGEAIVWIDYAAKLAIHRLRPAPPEERRAERLASATPDDNRISIGCVVVPVSFYETVVGPALGKSYGVVYVLPETQPVQRMLGALQLSLR
ncbi:MAG: hypothetical protein ACREBY_05680 [Polaromonas sp.]